jgi:hypothetical protein
MLRTEFEPAITAHLNCIDRRGNPPHTTVSLYIRITFTSEGTTSFMGMGLLAEGRTGQDMQTQPGSVPPKRQFTQNLHGASPSAATSLRWFLAREFFYPEDGGDMFLRNVGSHKIYMAPHPRRRHSS